MKTLLRYIVTSNNPVLSQIFLMFSGGSTVLLKMFRHYTVVLFLLLLLLKKLVVSNVSEGKDQEHFRSFDKDLVGTVEDYENFFKALFLILASLVFYLYVTKLLPQRLCKDDGWLQDRALKSATAGYEWYRTQSHHHHLVMSSLLEPLGHC